MEVERCLPARANISVKFALASCFELQKNFVLAWFCHHTSLFFWYFCTVNENCALKQQQQKNQDALSAVFISCSLSMFCAQNRHWHSKHTIRETLIWRFFNGCTLGNEYWDRLYGANWHSTSVEKREVICSACVIRDSLHSCPLVCHSIKSVTVSWAAPEGVSFTDVFAAAMWPSAFMWVSCLRDTIDIGHPLA